MENRGDNFDRQTDISVIVPVYNSEQYLAKCIDSILNQTFQNFEILLIDDGSTDGSGKICDEYVAKDGRIRVYHRENKGQAAARNFALDIAQGNYIGFVDSDDYIHPRMYEILLDNILKTNADICICNCLKTDSRNSEIKAVCEDTVCLKYGGAQFLKDTLKNPDGKEDYRCWVLWDKLYKKSCFRDIRLPDLRMAEDSMTVFKVLYNADVVAVTPLALYYYFQNSGSIIHDENIETHIDKVMSFRYMYDFFCEKNDLYLAQYCKSGFYYTIGDYYSKHKEMSEFKACDELKKLFLKYSRIDHLKIDGYEFWKSLYPNRTNLYCLWKAFLNKIGREAQ